jgi:hypothetical protein
MTGKGFQHVPSNVDPVSYAKDVEAEERAAVNRRSVLSSVLRYSQQNVIGAIGLVELAAALGVDEELDELAGDPEWAGRERHRRLAEARAELQLPVAESDGT